MKKERVILSALTLDLSIDNYFQLDPIELEETKN